MKTPLLRVQDSEGRGPYRPGTSHIWTDADHSDRNPTFMSEFGRSVLNKLRDGDHCGCAFQNMSQAEEWFSAAEIARLRAFGFRFVAIREYRILAQSDRQTIFAIKTPLWLVSERAEFWPHERRAA